MTGSDTEGPRVEKTIREKTSLLPGSCAPPGHLDPAGVSLTYRPPATGYGSLRQPNRTCPRWHTEQNYRGRPPSTRKISVSGGLEKASPTSSKRPASFCPRRS